MPVQVDDVRTLQNYMKQLLRRARHHARSVDQIVFPLAGAIIWKKSPKPLEVRSGRDGGMGVALWVTINRKRYAFSYNHAEECIDMKVGSFQGDVINKFSNKTSLPKLIEAFEAL